MALSFLPEKLAGRAAFSSEVCEDITGGTVGAKGLGPVVGMGFTTGYRKWRSFWCWGRGWYGLGVPRSVGSSGRGEDIFYGFVVLIIE